MAPDKYVPKEVEDKWVSLWEKDDTYRFNPASKKEFYSIDTPPPTVSGKMHIGHASSYTQMDVIARYKRMRGYELFYPFGTDDNGLPTERLVEKLKNVKGSRMPRDEFIKLCWQTLKEVKPDFIADWKNIGMSCDFKLYYSTIDKHCQGISQRSFIELYELGREYRAESPTIWCPTCETAVAQVELEDKEIDSNFIDVKFKLEDGSDLVIATTRPELFGACVAVFTHPSDKRYKKLVGKKAKTPLYDLWVPVIADERVNPDKGTGIVMCCTFGDQTDIEWYKQYKLPSRVIITSDGKMSDKAGVYAGLGIKEARKKVIEDLEKAGLLVNKKPIKHAVNVHERCGTEMEILISNQWFVRYLDLKDELIKMGNKLSWRPEFMKSRYMNWINGLKWDWCISRQRFFGIPFPVWYCSKCGEIIMASKDKLPVDPLIDKAPVSACPKCGSKEFTPEKDVMDTWATSSLTPRLAIELVDKKLKGKLFPESLRSNAHDIITFWLFNTVVKSLLHEDSVPWKDVIISGWVLDKHGKKMSKSKGNVIAPQDVLKDYSADALRFWATSSSLGEDVRFDDKELKRGAKIVTKLWNAARMVSMNGLSAGKGVSEFADEWILNRLNAVIVNATGDFDDYNYSHAKKEIVDFFWSDFCDNYLEMIKYRLYGTDASSKNSAVNTSIAVIKAVLKMMAPFMPFVTEEVWHELLGGKSSIHLESWPVAGKVSADLEKMGELLKQIISEGRQYKVSKQLSQGAEINEMTVNSPDDLKGLVDVIKGTLRVKELIVKKGSELKVVIN